MLTRWCRRWCSNVSSSLSIYRYPYSLSISIAMREGLFAYAYCTTLDSYRYCPINAYLSVLTYQYPYLSTINTHWYEYGLVSTLMHTSSHKSIGMGSESMATLGARHARIQLPSHSYGCFKWSRTDEYVCRAARFGAAAERCRVLARLKGSGRDRGRYHT